MRQRLQVRKLAYQVCGEHPENFFPGLYSYFFKNFIKEYEAVDEESWDYYDPSGLFFFFLYNPLQ